jgi:phenylalanyl-tRNA synthetase beta chain
MKERLASMGQKTINSVVDITNYVMWELGQPLHAFDFEKIQGGSMNIRLSKQGEELTTLDGATFALNDDTIVIEDAERLIDLAGIKGGTNTQIDTNTDTIIFQAAIFDPAHIRRSTQELSIKTDAAVRYMHGFDPNLPPQALERAVALLEETNPEAKIIQAIDSNPNQVNPKKINLDVQYANRLLGTYLSIREIRQILERLGFEVGKEKKLRVTSYQLQVTVPTHRLDINIPEDLVEEVGRIYGYHNIKPESPRAAIIAPLRNEQVFWRSMARGILAGFGFWEVYNYSMGSDNQGPEPSLTRPELQNPISREFSRLRVALWSGILKNAARNEKNFDSPEIFEIGKVFYKDKDTISENENCIFAISNSKDAGKGEGFYRIKGYLDEFFHKLGITDFYYDSALSKEEEECLAFLHPGRRANIVVDGAKIGFIGEIHPHTLQMHDVKRKVYCAEFNFAKVFSAAQDEHIYQKPSRFPEVVRDIAILVPAGTTVEEVSEVIESASGALLRDVDLFDMYEGENIPGGLKNLAFHLLFQSDERTLTSKEVDQEIAKITKALEEKLWEVRY